MDITKPIPERRAARQAAERLSEITRSIGVQATTSSCVVEVNEDTTAAKFYTKKKGECMNEVFGFTQEEMSSFREKIEQDKSMECPVEVRTIIITYVYVERFDDCS